MHCGFTRDLTDLLLTELLIVKRRKAALRVVVHPLLLVALPGTRLQVCPHPVPLLLLVSPAPALLSKPLLQTLKATATVTATVTVLLQLQLLSSSLSVSAHLCLQLQLQPAGENEKGSCTQQLHDFIPMTERVRSGLWL